MAYNNQRNYSNGGYPGGPDYHFYYENKPPVKKKKSPLVPVLIIILAALVIGLTAFFAIQLRHRVSQSTSSPEMTIAKLETGLNKMDTDIILGCFTKDIRTIYKGSVSAANDSLGIDLGSLSSVSGLLSSAGLTPDFKLTANNITYNGNTECIVNTTFDISYSGSSISETIDLTLTLVNGQWLISVDFGINEFI